MANSNSRLFGRGISCLAGLAFWACCGSDACAGPQSSAIVVRGAQPASRSMTQAQAKEMVLRFLADERYRQQEWLQASKSFVNRGGALSVSQNDGNARFLWGPWEINATARRAKLICLWPGGSWGYELNADVQREGDHFVLAQVRITKIRGLHRD